MVIDHPVFSDNETLSIQGCQVSHVSEAFQTKNQGNLVFKITDHAKGRVKKKYKKIMEWKNN